MRISHNTAPVLSTASVPYSLTPTSISTGHVSFQRQTQVPREKSARNSATKNMMTTYEKLKSIPKARNISKRMSLSNNWMRRQKR
jgi:predicted dithiol-disulfide oxidoreductase (DUF899 family)